MTWIRILCVTLLSVGAYGFEGETAEQTYRNPVINEIGPADPHVVFFEGTYYLYPTGDNVSYHVYTSTDLVHWTKGRKVFQPGERNVWAPDVFQNPKDKKFYLYYTVDKRIGVAVADRPLSSPAVAREHRSQYRNRELARERLKAKLKARRRGRRLRIPTQVPQSAQQQRLDEKKHRSRLKELRRKVDSS